MTGDARHFGIRRSFRQIGISLRPTCRSRLISRHGDVDFGKSTYFRMTIFRVAEKSPAVKV